MGRVIGVGWALCLAAAGCATSPPLDNPVIAKTTPIENPVLVSPGAPTPAAYQEVFEKCVDILGDYFYLQPPNPYAGVIVSKPRIAPGYEQFWKAGNPDPRARLLATFQTIRQIGTIEIRAGEHGGYLVYVVVDRELEDLSRPFIPRAGGALFMENPTVARPWDIVNGELTSDLMSSWFRIGRDYALEQEILCRIRKGE